MLLITLSMSLLTAPALAETSSLENISLELSEEARTAVDAGVVLSFTCRYAIRDSWWGISRERLVRTHRFTLTRHALSNRYIVKIGEGAPPHISRSTTEATNYIVANARKLLEAYSTPEHPYSMRLSIDKFALPTPMRLKAFVSNAWDLDTGWIVWKFAN